MKSLIGIILLLFTVSVNAASTAILCDMPTERVDQTPLPLTDIEGIVWVVDGTEVMQTDGCRFVLTGADGDYSVQAFTKDTGGRVSVLTPPKSFSLTTANPKPPMNLRLE